MAAIGAGVLLVGVAGSKVEATQPAHEGASSTKPHQQGHKGGLDPVLKKSLDAAFEKSFEQSRVPGAIAAIRTPEGTWVSTLGVANKASGKPMRAKMHHRIGSVTKTFTATLLLKADAQGLLSLDDTIDQYVKGVPNGDEITLRQMANMSSGIASYTADEQWANELLSGPHRVWKPEELAQIGIKDSPLFDPGTEWFYSNTNYTLLGLVLEKVTDKPIGDLYREQIIEPLGLQETSFPERDDSSLPAPQARGYTLQGQDDGEPVDSTDWNPSWGWTAGAMISTVDDLLVYGRALGTGEGLLPPEQQAQRLDSFLGDDIPPNNADRAYGLGFGKEFGWIGHTGTNPGYNTTVYYSPELDATMVVETNSDIPSGDCSDDNPTLADSPHDIPCEEPAKRIFGALAEALGQPFGTEQ